MTYFYLSAIQVNGCPYVATKIFTFTESLIPQKSYIIYKFQKFLQVRKIQLCLLFRTPLEMHTLKLKICRRNIMHIFVKIKVCMRLRTYTYVQIRTCRKAAYLCKNMCMLALYQTSQLFRSPLELLSLWNSRRVKLLFLCKFIVIMSP